MVSEEQTLPYYSRVLHRFIFFIIIILLFFSFYFFYFFKVKNIYQDNIIINIPQGSKLIEISNLILKNNNLLEKKIYLYYLVIWDKYFDKINYGEFEIDENHNLIDITYILSNPSNVYHEFTIVDGWQEYQINELLIQANFKDIKDIEYNTVLADTYYYQLHNSFQEIYKYMKKTKESFFNKYENNILLNKYDQNQIITISSLIEKEGIDDNDKKLISSVIFNRLNKKMKLQIDASTIFAITQGKYKLNRKLTLEDLKIKDEYNTYYVQGLPPKPICFVSRKTIEIVLENYISDYLFYFYDNNLKKHIYSKSFNEHKIKLNQYRSSK